MAYTDIDKPSDYFNTILWSGDGTGNRSLTGVGFKPDWVWTKLRSTAGSHQIYDIVRGATKDLESDNTNAESTSNEDGFLNSFDSDGFTMNDGSSSDFYNNDTGKTYVAWNWLAGGTASSNTDGSITSSVSANTTAGFSIVSYTGTGANATVGHGLSSAPACYVVKSRDSANDWRMYHVGTGETKFMILNQTSSATTATNNWNDTAPTSSVFSLGTGTSVNKSGDDYIGYCFAEKKGYSKFGSYTGNGNTDSPFIYLGFKPAMVIFKNTTTSGYNWEMRDNKRPNTFNPVEARLYPNASTAESNDEAIDFCSNGFKLRGTASNWNRSGDTIIYMAFAEQPLVGTNNIPATAR